MAKYDSEQNVRKAPPSTDPEIMLENAKDYARTEFTSIMTLLKDELKIDLEEDFVAKAWIKVKYDQIVESRTKRATYFD